MAYINVERGCIRFKLVYYGPVSSGKTANLEYLHALTKGRTPLEKFTTEEDGEVYYESMSLRLGKIRGIETALTLLSAPGRIDLKQTRAKILEEADGIVFVADSRAEALEDNVASLEDLEELLIEKQIRLSDLPIILQYNKRDIENALAVGVLEEKLNRNKWPWLDTSATEGRNIKNTLSIASQLVYQEAARYYSLTPSKTPMPKPQVQPPVSTETKATIGTGSVEEFPREEDADDRETVEIQTEELADGVARQIINSIPPEDALGSQRVIGATTAPPAAPRELTDLYRVISDLKDCMLERIAEVNEGIRNIQSEWESERDHLRQKLEEITDRPEGFDDIIDRLMEVIERVMQAQVDGHLAEFLDETKK